MYVVWYLNSSGIYSIKAKNQSVLYFCIILKICCASAHFVDHFIVLHLTVLCGNTLYIKQYKSDIQTSKQ